MAKVFKVFKEPIAHFWLGKDFRVSRKLKYLISSEVDILVWEVSDFLAALLSPFSLGHKNKSIGNA